MRNKSAYSTSRIAATALETALNAYLRLDAEYEQQLAGLLGTTAGITLSSFDTTFYFTATAGGVRVRNHAPGLVDVVIETAGPLALLQLVRSRHFDDETAIHGDSGVARRWQTLLRNIDIDWEEHLSRAVGDIAAHQLANTARASLNWSRNTADSLLQNASEYLQYEHNDLPSRYAVEYFLDAVDALQADTERLAARIERLQRICSDTAASD